MWCTPALIVAVALRVVLTVQLPYAVYHDDTADFLSTPDKLFADGDFDIHSKKTFLVPTVFTIPFVVRVPALIAIPVFQHLLGVVQVLLVGLLCQLWFRYWKVFIVPLTLIMAANPFLLWYEHTLMAETIFVFCTVLVALAGTLYTLKPTWGRLAFLGVALVLEAGGRPEGKLLFGFGLFLLLLIHAREWRTMWPRVAAMLVAAIITHVSTRTSQAGLLLYTSVMRLTPTDLKVAPGLDPYIASLRAELQKKWAERPQFPNVRDRRAIADAVTEYVKANPKLGVGTGHRSVNEFCLKLATETCRRNFFKLPELTYHKFRMVATESPSGSLDKDWIFRKQYQAYLEEADVPLRLSKGLTGTVLSKKEDLTHFVDTHFSEVGWFTWWSDVWLRAVNSFRFPDANYKEEWHTVVYPGIPVYFALAAVGCIAVMFRRGILQPFHIAWGLTLLGFFYVIILTANVRPRFRFVFEPFWFIYIGLLAETLWIVTTRLVARR